MASQVIRIEEPELVGEFLQCLKIFQVNQHDDPDLWQIMQYGMLYLIDVEKRKGSKGNTSQLVYVDTPPE